MGVRQPGQLAFQLAVDGAQSGGGCVMDLGVHLADLALWLTCFPAVDNVTSRLFA